MLPYLTRLEADADFGKERWHGDDGPMPVTRYRDLELTDVAAAGFEAVEAVGFPVAGDHNCPGAVGVGRMPMSSRQGIRVTTADAYLPLATPPKLTVRADTQVADVVFDGSRASGVRLIDGSVVKGGWVVLRAGTYGSPAILMRSGVGPVEHLRWVTRSASGWTCRGWVRTSPTTPVSILTAATEAGLAVPQSSISRRPSTAPQTRLSRGPT